MMGFAELDMAIKAITLRHGKRSTIFCCVMQRRTRRFPGKKLRVDSTVCETNIHYPTDASLLWDSFRIASRLMRQIVSEAPILSVGNRFHDKVAKRLYTFVSTHAGKKEVIRAMRKNMRKLIEKVNWICEMAHAFIRNADKKSIPSFEAIGLLQELREKLPLMEQVSACAQRVYAGEKVPASDRVFSIFEPHYGTS